MQELINWFPGHMAKSIKELKEKIKLVDLVIELRDARIASLSDSNIFKDLISNKEHLIILTKSAFADQTKLSNFIKQHSNMIAIDLVKGLNVGKVKPFIDSFTNKIYERRLRQSIINKVIKILVIGFPNVGKSTFINFLNNKRSLKVGNIPGITKSTKMWIKVNDYLLLDSPGILFPKFKSVEESYMISLTGVVKEEILPLREIIDFGINYCLKNYKEKLLNRFNLETEDNLYYNISKKRGCLVKDRIDYNKLYRLLFQEFKNGLILPLFYDQRFI